MNGGNEKECVRRWKGAMSNISSRALLTRRHLRLKRSPKKRLEKTRQKDANYMEKKKNGVKEKNQFEYITKKKSFIYSPLWDWTTNVLTLTRTHTHTHTSSPVDYIYTCTLTCVPTHKYEYRELRALKMYTVPCEKKRGGRVYYSLHGIKSRMWNVIFICLCTYEKISTTKIGSASLEERKNNEEISASRYSHPCSRFAPFSEFCEKMTKKWQKKTAENRTRWKIITRERTWTKSIFYDE